MNVWVEFVEARLDDDEVVARGAAEGPWKVSAASAWAQQGQEMADVVTESLIEGTGSPLVVAGDYEGFGACTVPNAEHITRHDPTSALRRVNATRALLTDLLAEPHFTCDDPYYSCYATLEPGDLGDIEVGACNCGRDARVLRRVKIIAKPYAGHEAYPAE